MPPRLAGSYGSATSLRPPGPRTTTVAGLYGDPILRPPASPWHNARDSQVAAATFGARTGYKNLGRGVRAEVMPDLQAARDQPNAHSENHEQVQQGLPSPFAVRGGLASLRRRPESAAAATTGRPRASVRRCSVSPAAGRRLAPRPASW
jgi:hypothetical protein